MWKKLKKILANEDGAISVIEAAIIYPIVFFCLLVLIFIGLYIMLFKQKAAVFSFAVSGCIGTSLILAMLISSAVGTLIPLFFKKIKVDPAVASGPLITTINDLVAVVTYYGISKILLIDLLHLA